MPPNCLPHLYLAVHPFSMFVQKDEINLALAELRYTGSVDAVGDDNITVTSSDGLLEGTASATVSLAWPTGAATRPPTLSFRPPLTEMPEDGSTLLGPIDVRFGDGRTVVHGTVSCSTGTFKLGWKGGDDGDNRIVVVDGETEGDTVKLRGLPRDVAEALSMVAYTPPKNWSSRVHGVVTLTMEVQPAQASEVRGVSVSCWKTRMPSTDPGQEPTSDIMKSMLYQMPPQMPPCAGNEM